MNNSTVKKKNGSHREKERALKTGRNSHVDRKYASLNICWNWNSKKVCSEMRFHGTAQNNPKYATSNLKLLTLQSTCR